LRARESYMAHRLPEGQDVRNRYWSSVASDYRSHWSTTHADGKLYARIEAAMLSEFIGASEGRRVLDLCCGTGRNSVAIAMSGASVVGIDGAEGMVEQARNVARERDLENVEFLVGDSRQLPFANDEFDAVVGTRFMYMMDQEEKRRIIQEAARVVRPGGAVVLHFNGFLFGLRHEFGNLVRGRMCRMRDRYLWPGTVGRMFQGLRVERVVGVKLPNLAILERAIGSKTALQVNRLARVPFIRFLCQYILVVARKGGTPLPGIAPITSEERMDCDSVSS